MLNTIHAEFFVDALNEAIGTYDSLEIMNTDQSRQFIGVAWFSMRPDALIRLSMDDRDGCMEL